MLRAEMIEQAAYEMAALLTELNEDKVLSMAAFKRQAENAVCRFNMAISDWDGSSSEED